MENEKGAKSLNMVKTWGKLGAQFGFYAQGARTLERPEREVEGDIAPPSASKKKIKIEKILELEPIVSMTH